MRPIVLNEPFRAVFYAPFYVAEARGLYARQGVAVTRDTAGDPNKAAENLLAGRADIAWSGPMRPILLRARDPACTLRSFCAVVMKDPFYLLGFGARPGFALGDLARLRFGVVSEVPTPWWCLQDDLRRAGIDPAALAIEATMTMAQNADAVAAGTLDIAMMFEPFASLLEARGGQVWHATADRGLCAYTSLYATEARIAERDEEFCAMIRAIGEALGWIADAAPAEIAATIAAHFPDTPRDVLAAALARYQRNGIWSPTPRFPRAAFLRLRDTMKSCGVIATEPRFEDCVDEAIVTRALGR